ncbi:hypothetical protein LP123_12430 [Moraxella bovis]|uniref:Uncharacterized protein n=1 Tax=Moraxella bovis TaxID=476 RepID=A0AAQ2T370_MORBO|nr:hypothetical protein [Moraxella bovis]UYZ76107.1 hypothetical protein LP093_01875 [Moraxella bovis]UYZ77940.1 hypothetical protein LP115_11920 [Moraxella bovis]UYZ80829.1 hypothetical protein LP113_12570 [Moraxella bovis]UYZ86426.1 hypothetical protein LP094_11970 [Moraxella bovis]UYZ89875.1 hypothetical protein LP114_01900 [Moraxella bovis]
MMSQELTHKLLTKNPYFNVSGLTSSEANYICERIKETLKPIQDEITNLETHTSSLDGESLDNFKKVNDIDGKLANIGKLYAISAFFRSAIKEKDNRLDMINIKIKQVRDEQDSLLVGIDVLELQRLINVAMEDYLLTLPLSDVITYKTAEAKASHIGKFIHNFDKIRTSLTKKERISFKEVGEQVFKIHHTPLYELDELQQLQNYLLAEHREHESTVNAYKAKFREFQNKSLVAYEEEYNKRSHERQMLLNEKVKAETEKLIAIKNEIANFKIIVPNEFKAIIDELLTVKL